MIREVSEIEIKNTVLVAAKYPKMHKNDNH